MNLLSKKLISGATSLLHDYWTTKGNTARAAQKWRIAARYYERLPAARFELAEVWVSEGRELASTGQTRDAEVAFNKAIAALPHRPTAFVELGNLMMTRGERAKAVRYFLEALRRDRERKDLEILLEDLGARSESQAIISNKDPYPIEGQIGSYFWWHSIDLGKGLVTPGHMSLSKMATRYQETFGPLDVKQKSVLDVGAWNGAFSVEAARRGAKRVVGLDHATWNNPVFRGRRTFDLVNRISGLGLEAEDVDLDSRRLDLQPLGPFDIVLFLGVFYHLRDPLAAVAEVASRATEVLVVETHVERTFSRRPSMTYYPHDELNGDPTNWWGPNAECMIDMLKNLNFPRIDISKGSSRDRRVFHAYRQRFG